MLIRLNIAIIINSRIAVRERRQLSPPLGQKSVGPRQDSEILLVTSISVTIAINIAINITIDIAKLNIAISIIELNNTINIVINLIIKKKYHYLTIIHITKILI